MKHRVSVLFLAGAYAVTAAEQVTPIDRHALATRHNVALTNAVFHSVLQIGNGEFAFGVDATGLQTSMGNTMSQWGWHFFPLPAGQRPEGLKLEAFDTHGRSVGYATNPKGLEALFAWLRENPHRISLGRLRLLLDGRPVALKSLTGFRQELDLWSGLIVTRYTLDGQAVRVETCCHPTRDCVAVRIESPLVGAGRLAVELAFPYGAPGVTGADWNKPLAHTTTLRLSGPQRADLVRQLDADRYAVSVAWSGAVALREVQPHTFTLNSQPDAAALEAVCAFSAQPDASVLPDFHSVKEAAADHWPTFWKSGGAIDLSARALPGLAGLSLFA